MAARGERPEIISRVMRHKSVAFTYDRYVKVHQTDLDDAILRQDKRLIR